MRHLAALAALPALLAGCAASADEGPAVAAASSLRAVMPALATGYNGPPPILSYGASGLIVRQVEAGAPLAVVVLAGEAEANRLARAGLIVDGSRRTVATNRLVLIAGRDSTLPQGIGFADLDRLPPRARLAVGDPRTVPAGRYARSALERLGHWSNLQDRLLLGGDVAAVLAYARRGEADAAIVYASELGTGGSVEVLDRFHPDPAETPPVIVAAVRGAAPGALAFLDYLESPAAARVFSDYGFEPAR